MGADDGSVDDRSLFILVGFDRERGEQEFPDAFFRPAAKPVVDALLRAEALGKVSPWDAGSSAVDDGVDEPAVINFRLRTGLSRRHHGLNSRPLLVGQFMPSHGKL